MTIIFSIVLIISYIVVSLNRPFKFRIVEYPNRNRFVIERQYRILKFWKDWLVQRYDGEIIEGEPGNNILEFTSLKAAQDCLNDYAAYLHKNSTDNCKIYKVEFRIIED